MIERIPRLTTTVTLIEMGANCHCLPCSETIFEAWEHMTYGGLGFGGYDRTYVNHPGVYGLIYYSGCETIRVAR